MPVSRNLIVSLSTVVLLITSISVGSFTLFLPSMETEFGWSRVMVTVPYTVAMVAWGIGSPIFGKLADDFGTRPVILGGTLLMAAGFLGMGLAQNLWQLTLCFGILVGLAMGACGLSIISLLVAKHFDAASRGRAVGLVQMASPLNALLLAPVLFMLIEKSNWRMAALFIGALLLFIAFPLAWIGARDPRAPHPAERARIGWRACLPYLRDKTIMALFLARLACGLAFYQIAHLVPLAISKGVEPAVAALAVSVFGGSAVLMTFLSGWLADRYGRGRVLGITYFLRGIGTIGLAFAVPNETWLFLLVVVGIGPTYGTVAVNNVMFFEAIGPKLAGMILGISFIVHQVGAAGGPLVGSIAYDMTGTYDVYTFVIGLVLLATGAITYKIKDVSNAVPRQAVAEAAQ